MFRIVAHYKGFSLNPGGTAIHMNTTVKFNIYSREIHPGNQDGNAAHLLNCRQIGILLTASVHAGLAFFAVAALSPTPRRCDGLKQR